jgi:hypothetical protein
MKKLLPSITLALTSLAGFSGLANAGHVFGLFTGCHCCKDCGGTITLRQYNAFSPVACGSMMFQGCVMSPPPPAPSAYPFDGFNGFSGDCGDGSCGGVPVSRAPGAIQGNGYAYSYPIATYPGATYPGMTYPGATYSSAAYPGVTYPGIAYSGMPAMQMPQMQQPMPAAQMTGQAMPAAARVP